jgi:hypothetical protein
VGDATHVVFNFPHSGEDEDEEGHRRLMSEFLASLAAAMLRRSSGSRSSSAAPSSKQRRQAARRGGVLLLMLCNDQWSRWHVEAAARDAFFFLEGGRAPCGGRRVRGAGCSNLSAAAAAHRSLTLAALLLDLHSLLLAHYAPPRTRRAGMAPFPADAFDGYSPRRGYSDEAFPFSRALTYTLAFRPPPGLC